MSSKITQSSNEAIESLLQERLRAIENTTEGDVISFMGQIYWYVDDVIRDNIETIQDKKVRLYFFLETSGGFVEPVQRIADTLRHHYGEVNFVIPSHAMSAGTVLAMSGDSILMDYYSILGPIDPQVEDANGKFVPALGYLKQYERMIEKSEKGMLSTAEMAFMIEKFDPGTLYRYEQEKELSIALLRKWLATYKFKNWKETETRRSTVTEEMKRKRAEEIGNILSDPDRWHSHGIGINMKTLTTEVNLKIEDFGLNADLNEQIRRYFGLLRDYRFRLGNNYVVHTREKYQGW